MGAFRIRFDATGVEPVEHRLLGIGGRASNAAPVLHRIADDLRDMEKKLFASEDAWPPLKESTLQAKRRAGYPPDILKATEALFESLTQSGGGVIGAAGGFEIVTDDSLHFGTGIEYARFHRFGTRNMPKRDPLIVTQRDRKRWTRMVQRHLMAEERAMFGVPEGPIGNVFGV